MRNFSWNVAASIARVSSMAGSALRKTVLAFSVFCVVELRSGSTNQLAFPKSFVPLLVCVGAPFNASGVRGKFIIRLAAITR